MSAAKIMQNTKNLTKLGIAVPDGLHNSRQKPDRRPFRHTSFPPKPVAVASESIQTALTERPKFGSTSRKPKENIQL